MTTNATRSHVKSVKFKNIQAVNENEVTDLMLFKRLQPEEASEE